MLEEHCRLEVVDSDQCYFQLSPGGNPPPPRIPNSPPPENTQNTKKNIKKCVEFTSQICVSPQNLESRINTGLGLSPLYRVVYNTPLCATY